MRAAVLAARGERDADLPWRHTRDPYAILVSEIMLQQTQVPRVIPRYTEFLETFPTFEALAAAPLSAVLETWQGLGYNRRAVQLKRIAEAVVNDHGGVLPQDVDMLDSFPGVGRATACAVATYAFGTFAPYIETNIRAVILHHLFGDRKDVSDREIMPYVAETWDREDPRAWGYALMDLGARLKRELPNPSRRSRHHVRQSRFEGSSRQRRARLLREVLRDPGRGDDEYAACLDIRESEAVRLLEGLASEGLLVCEEGRYSVPD